MSGMTTRCPARVRGSTKSRAAGEPFFQKRAPEQRPEWIETVELRFPSGRTAREIVVRDAAHVVGEAAAQAIPARRRGRTSSGGFGCPGSFNARCSGSAPRRPQTSGTRSGCCDPAPSQHDATLLVHCMHGRRQMTATRRPVMGSVVTIGSVRMIHPLSQRGSGQGINLARFGQPSLFKSPGRRFGSRANILRAAFRCQSRRFP